MQMQVRPPAGYKPRTEDGLFRPSTQGSLTKALAKPGQLAAISPNSPRPAEMLEGVTIDSGGAALTADDSALHELLVSVAYEADPTMPSGAVHAVPMSHVLHFLGEHVRRDTVKASMRKLMATTVSYGTKATRRYEQVPLLTSWTETTEDEDIIGFTLPEPICALMRSQPRYAYIELAAVSAMRCRYSSRLYRVLALEAAKTRWEPGGDNTVVVSATPSDLAEWVGFPRCKDGTVAYGKLKERLLSFLEDRGDQNEGDGRRPPLPSDLKAVRRFSTEIREVRKPGRGREVERVEFLLRLRAPSYRLVRTRFDPKDDIARVGGRDAEPYRVNSHIWRRAQKTFMRRLAMPHSGMFELWTIALNEALSGTPLSDEFHTREFRGERLLAAARADGADYAAWGFLSEEADEPDLAALSPVTEHKERRTRSEAAEDARLARLGKQPKACRVPATIREEPQPVSSQAQVTFDDCREVILTVDQAMSVSDVESIIAPAVKTWAYTGSRSVTVTLRYWVGGAYNRWRVGAFAMSEDDLDGLQKRLWNYLDGPEELGP